MPFMDFDSSAPNRIAARAGGRRQQAGAAAPPPDPTAAGQSYYQPGVEQQLNGMNPEVLQSMMSNALRPGSAPAPTPTPSKETPYAPGQDHWPEGAQHIGTAVITPPPPAPSVQHYISPTPAPTGVAAMLGGNPPPAMPARPDPWAADSDVGEWLRRGQQLPQPTPPLRPGIDDGKGFLGNTGDYTAPPSFNPPAANQRSDVGRSFAGTGGDYGQSSAMQMLRAAMQRGDVPKAPTSGPVTPDQFFPMMAGFAPGATPSMKELLDMADAAVEKQGKITDERDQLPVEQFNKLVNQPMTPAQKQQFMASSPPPAAAPPGPPPLPFEDPKPQVVNIPGIGPRITVGNVTGAPKDVTPGIAPIDLKNPSTIPPFPPGGVKSFQPMPAPPGIDPQAWDQYQRGAMDRQFGGLSPQGGPAGTPIFAPTFEKFLDRYRLPGGALAMPDRERAMQDWNAMLAGHEGNAKLGLGLGNLGIEGGKLGLEREKIEKTFDPRFIAADIIRARSQAGQAMTETEQRALFESMRSLFNNPPPVPGTTSAAAPSAAATNIDSEFANDARLRPIMSAHEDLAKKTPDRNNIENFLLETHKKLGADQFKASLPSVLKLAAAKYPGALRDFMRPGWVGNVLRLDRPFGEAWRRTAALGMPANPAPSDDIRAMIRSSGLPQE